MDERIISAEADRDLKASLIDQLCAAHRIKVHDNSITVLPWENLVTV